MFDFLLTLIPITTTNCLLHDGKHNEKELLLRTAAGDQNAFSLLFHQYHSELAEYVFRLTRSLSMTEEIVQDSFIKLWMKKEQLAEVKDLRSYLFTISRNHTFNCLRDLARKAMQQRAWITREIGQSQGHSDSIWQGEGADREYYFTLIEEAVGRLSPQQQKVYLLSRRDGLKYEEIAERLQLSHNTVKRHMSLALHTIVSYVRAHATQALPLIPFILSFL
jgi:RNA polymerase sigma-70 factor (family 1)